MFEKEAEEYAEWTKTEKELEVLNTVRDWGQESLTPEERILLVGIQDRERAREQGFKNGAEFGYNKANEWHYVSKKDYPKDFKDIWICFITEEDMKDYVRGWYEYDIDLDEHYFKTSNDFGIATIKNVYAWMPLVPPKEIE